MTPGLGINVIDKTTFARLQNLELKRTSRKFHALVESKHKVTVAVIYVTSEDGGCLLSSEIAQELGLVSSHLNQLNNGTIPNTSAPPPQVKSPTNDENLQYILDKHAAVFRGLGKLKDRQVTLSIDEIVTPVAQPRRRNIFFSKTVGHLIDSRTHHLPAHQSIIHSADNHKPTSR